MWMERWPGEKLCQSCVSQKDLTSSSEGHLCVFSRNFSRSGPNWEGENCTIWEPELTIGHTRGEVLSFVSAPAGVTGGRPGWLRRLALQHVDDVHAVDTLQSHVQALHCRGTKETRLKGQDRGLPGQTASNTCYSKEKLQSDSLFALLPSRVAHRLSSAELCSSSELGFSTRILLMSSTLS